jgi:TRAP-type C4-dicarboxylate transport system permease small subunit
MQEPLRRLYHPIVSVAKIANALGTIVIFGLVAIMNVDVIARGVFHAPLRGVVEMVIFSLVLIVFLQLPDVIHSNRLTRSDGFLQLADRKMPSVGDGLRRVIDFAAFVFMALITWTIWPEFQESFETCQFADAGALGGEDGLLAGLKIAMSRCEYFGTPGIFVAPWWPVKLAVAASVTLCAVIFLFKALIGDQARPPASDQGSAA